MPKSTLSPQLEVIIATLLWGMGGVLIKIIGVAPPVLSLFRMGIPSIILIGYFLAVRKKFPKWNKTLYLTSFINAVRMLLYFAAFSLTSVGNAVVTLYTWPIWVALLGGFFFGEKVTKREGILVALAFVGILALNINKPFSFTSNDTIGMVLMIISAALYALTLLFLKKESQTLSNSETVYMQNAFGALLFIPALLFFPIPNTTQIGLAIVYATIIGLGGYVLFFSALRKLKATTIATLSNLEAISGIIYATILISEPITPGILIGGACILIATTLIRTKHNPSKKAPEE